MARYLKNFEKHSLLARRKNNTATKMLEDKLKHMEQKFNRDFKQYLRVKSRVQTELRVIEDVASEYDEDQCSNFVVPTLQLHRPVEELQSSRKKGFVSATNQLTKSELLSDNKKLVTYPNSSKRGSRSINNSPNIQSPFSEGPTANEMPSLKGCSRKNEDSSTMSAKIHYNYQQLSSFAPDASRSHKILTENNLLPDVTVENNVSIVHKSTARTTPKAEGSVQLSSDILCQYSPNSQACHCRHFPCVTPKTYHTIGQGRNEMNHVSSDVIDSSISKLTTRMGQKIPHYSVNQTASNSKMAVNEDLHNSSKSTSNLSSNLSHAKEKVGLKLRSVNELGLRPVYSEPRLERRGSLQSKLPTEVSNRPRVTIKDKIRGLKQMVSEMRAKNERNKPREWVVNYGQHFPPRVLLNPVMP